MIRGRQGSGKQKELQLAVKRMLSATYVWYWRLVEGRNAGVEMSYSAQEIVALRGILGDYGGVRRLLLSSLLILVNDSATGFRLK